MADLDAVRALMPRAVEGFVRVTGLVDNAGITGRIGDSLDVPVDEVEQVLRGNTLTPHVLMQSALVHMSAASGGAGGAGGAGGCIVNISAGAAITGAPGQYVPYAVSKAGLNAASTGLSREFAPYGVRVNTVSP